MPHVLHSHSFSSSVTCEVSVFLPFLLPHDDRSRRYTSQSPFRLISREHASYCLESRKWRTSSPMLSRLARLTSALSSSLIVCPYLHQSDMQPLTLYFQAHTCLPATRGPCYDECFLLFVVVGHVVERVGVILGEVCRTQVCPCGGCIPTMTRLCDARSTAVKITLP